MKNTQSYKLAALILLLAAGFASCELDDRVHDLTGGYEGIFIDKISGDTVATEFYGAKIKLLDLAYGSAAQPLVFNTQPNGYYNNTKVYPSDYKVWAEGPFFEVDTITEKIKKPIRTDLYVIPNVDLEISHIEVKYGVTAEITYRYTVNDTRSENSEIGVVYGTVQYPGFRTAMNETESSASTYKRIRTGITEGSGEFTDILYLKPGTMYYIRTLGRTASAGDYWNYSKQHIIKTGSVDISQIPVEMKQGVTSTTSAILQWAFPGSLVDKIKLSYTDRDGENVTDEIRADDYSYVANLPHGSNTGIKVELFAKDGTSGGEKMIHVQTSTPDDAYVPVESLRPGNVPLCNDENFKYSLSKSHAEIKGPSMDPGWVTSEIRHIFLDWWSAQLFGNPPSYMPSCRDIENYTEFTLYGDVKTLIDLLPFVNLEKLFIRQGELFSEGLSIDQRTDLSVLRKLKNLKEVVLGPGVSLSEADFRNAGLSSLTVTKE